MVEVAVIGVEFLANVASGKGAFFDAGIFKQRFIEDTGLEVIDVAAVNIVFCVECIFIHAFSLSLVIFIFGLDLILLFTCC